MIDISDEEFRKFQKFIFEAAGITLSDTKKPLVSGRLAKRLQHFQFDSYGKYFQMLSNGGAADEVQIAIDLLTTNETYFFREQKHFDFLRQRAAAHRQREPFRVWSAACSSGEEAYSIAMVLADCQPGQPWEVLGSDISTRVLQQARRGHYLDERARLVPHDYLQRFCLKGTGEHQGTMLVDRNLRSRVEFHQANLTQPLPPLGAFDFVFLRNVMIYFNDDTKRRVVRNVLSLLKQDGILLVGHSESLNGISDAVRQLSPAIYVKK